MSGVMGGEVEEGKVLSGVLVEEAERSECQVCQKGRLERGKCCQVASGGGVCRERVE